MNSTIAELCLSTLTAKITHNEFKQLYSIQEQGLGFPVRAMSKGRYTTPGPKDQQQCNTETRNGYLPTACSTPFTKVWAMPPNICSPSPNISLNSPLLISRGAGAERQTEITTATQHARRNMSLVLMKGQSPMSRQYTLILSLR